MSLVKNKPKYIADHLYTADPSAHVFNGKLYIYPSHDIESGVEENDNGDHFNMQDYHVFSMDNINGEVTDHGCVLKLDDIPWAGRQMWAPDAAEKDGKYYLYYPMKDKNDIFRMGVAVSNKPEGPFVPEPTPMDGSYSIDPAVFQDNKEDYYMYFGGIWGGQLQRYRDNKAIEVGQEPADHEDALCPKVVKLSKDMKGFAEEPKDLVILDENGEPLKAGDHERRYFEGPWMHRYKDKYYFSYSTGNTHRICYAVSNSPYGPFHYTGVVLTPVVGWTTHHSIVEFNGKWYLFYHDSQPSGGKTWLRSVKFIEIEFNEDGTISTVDGEM
ncbi:glycoside hydrolase family 43 protein [Flammeovirga pacifica]|uniref:glycoside hydrolase family 43 protein n=1 Tax=Flammeovirga pacifica TaxID=915059 RepID=UPI000A0757A6|nr:glycoside hydrolase family 43 protein [Flammeovirga pacifica]